MQIESNIDILLDTQLGELDTFTDLKNKCLYVSFVFNDTMLN